MELLRISTTPFTPKTRAGQLAKLIHNECKTFTDFWFGRDARKTNDRLIELSCDVFIIYTCIVQLETEQKCRKDLIDHLNKYDAKKLNTVLRLGGTPENKTQLKASRRRLIEGWKELTPIIVKLWGKE